MIHRERLFLSLSLHVYFFRDVFPNFTPPSRQILYICVGDWSHYYWQSSQFMTRPCLHNAGIGFILLMTLPILLFLSHWGTFFLQPSNHFARISVYYCRYVPSAAVYDSLNYYIAFPSPLFPSLFFSIPIYSVYVLVLSYYTFYARIFVPCLVQLLNILFLDL